MANVKTPEPIPLIIGDPILLRRVGPDKQEDQQGKLLDKCQVLKQKTDCDKLWYLIPSTYER